MDSIIAASPRETWMQLHERQLLNVLDDLCRFILHEVVNVKGKFFDETQELAMDDKYLSLHEWHNQGHG